MKGHRSSTVLPAEFLHAELVDGGGRQRHCDRQAISFTAAVGDGDALDDLLQQVDMLEQRGWSRSRARDYYDIWRVLGAFRDRIDLTDFGSLLRQKCAVRGVTFTGPEDFFQDHMLTYVEATWEQWLGPLVPGLPSFKTVLGELHPQVGALLRSGR